MPVPETVADILAAHRADAMTPADTVARSFARIRAYGDPAVFITLRDENDAVAEAKEVVARGKHLPLYGIPVAVKDNIDVAGMATTAACPAFAYQPHRDATAVARLREAGAILIGKTNLDQFATGLVGVRSPYGVPRNTLDPKLIPGGSSSGSAVAVAAGMVPLALGTDTAGSGRVPAMLNNIVGLKPSLGLVSTYGVLPACRTLDCVSVFALTTDDAFAALAVMAGRDVNDPFARARPLGAIGTKPAAFRIGVPRPGERVFFGDTQAASDYAAALDRLARLGGALVEIDIEPFYETARLLYEGPWVAERYAVAESLIASSPDSMHPVTREIILGGARPNAVAAFKAFYRLEELRRAAEHTFGRVDLLALPTAPTVYTIDQVLADPIQLNSRLGTYTNFVNLLDLCGLALPAALHGARPFGITLLAPGGRDALLASIGRVFHADTALPLGALALPQPPLEVPPAAAPGEAIPLAVVGAHLSGMPLNHELAAHRAHFVQGAETAPDYRLYALAGAGPRKPGLLRVAPGEGAAIALEIWALPPAEFGRFVAAVPPPLSIGSIRLADGRLVKGFLVEAEAVAGARDISSFGGWRAFVAAAE
jgi:allophanate hydrolase